MSNEPQAKAAGQKRAEPEIDYDRLDELAALFQREIRDRAAVWGEDFDAGPGLVVSVSDAARVAARVVLEKLTGSDQR